MQRNMDNTEFDLKKAVSDRRLVGLWRTMTGFHWTYLGALTTVGLAALFQMGNSLLLRYLVDDVVGQGIFDRTLVYVALGFIALSLGEGAFSFVSGKLSARTAEGLARRLRNFLYDHIQRLSFTYHDRTETGGLIQRATSDVDAVRQFFADQAINAGRIILLFVVNLVALAILNLRLALVSVAVVPLIIGVSVFFFKRITEAYEAFQDQEAELSTTLQENLSGVRVVKAFARQAYERDKFERDNAEQYRLGRRLLTFHALFWPSSDVLCSLQMLGAFLFGALMAIDGAMTVGTYLAAARMIIWLIWPMRNLGRLIVQMSTGLVSYNRVMELVREDREPLEEGLVGEVGSVRGEIAFQAVCFEYDGGDDRVLKDVSFHCEPGQTVALLGSTGSGKTSLVNLLPRFYEITGGQVTLDGVPLEAYSRRFLRRNVGIVEQEPFLFSRTVRENITYGVGRDVSDDEVEKAARSAAIHDVVLSFPDGYDTLVGEKGVTLSGGQKQRVAIARTLLRDPRILILDDATSSVDTETEGEIREALVRLMEGRTTFIIAHRIQSVMDADLILVLDKGQVVQRGTHEDLLGRPGMYRQIYRVQAQIEDELQRELSGQGDEVWETEGPWAGERKNEELAHVGA